jgi:hypothetical protein
VSNDSLRIVWDIIYWSTQLLTWYAYVFIGARVEIPMTLCVYGCSLVCSFFKQSLEAAFLKLDSPTCLLLVTQFFPFAKLTLLRDMS